jgi:hypothetical protein
VEEVMKNIKNNFKTVLVVKLPPPDPFNGSVLNFQQNDCVRYANRVR